MADRLDRLAMVEDRYMEYVRLWADKKERFKDVPLEVYNKEVLPVQILLDQMSEVVGKFADKFLTEYPSMLAPKPEPGLFDAQEEGMEAYRMTTGEFIDSKYFAQFLTENLDTQVKIIREQHFNVVESSLQEDPDRDDLAAEEHKKIMKALRKTPGELGNELFGKVLMKVCKIELPKTKPEPEEK